MTPESTGQRPPAAMPRELAINGSLIRRGARVWVYPNPDGPPRLRRVCLLLPGAVPVTSVVVCCSDGLAHPPGHCYADDESGRMELRARLQNLIAHHEGEALAAAQALASFDARAQQQPEPLTRQQR